MASRAPRTDPLTGSANFTQMSFFWVTLLLLCCIGSNRAALLSNGATVLQGMNGQYTARTELSVSQTLSASGNHYLQTGFAVVRPTDDTVWQVEGVQFHLACSRMSRTAPRGTSPDFGWDAQPFLKNYRIVLEFYDSCGSNHDVPCDEAYDYEIIPGSSVRKLSTHSWGTLYRATLHATDMRNGKGHFLLGDRPERTRVTWMSPISVAPRNDDAYEYRVYLTLQSNFTSSYYSVFRDPGDTMGRGWDTWTPSVTVSPHLYHSLPHPVAPHLIAGRALSTVPAPTPPPPQSTPPTPAAPPPPIPTPQPPPTPTSLPPPATRPSPTPSSPTLPATHAPPTPSESPLPSPSVPTTTTPTSEAQPSPSVIPSATAPTPQPTQDGPATPHPTAAATSESNGMSGAGIAGLISGLIVILLLGILIVSLIVRRHRQRHGNNENDDSSLFAEYFPDFDRESSSEPFGHRIKSFFDFKNPFTRRRTYDSLELRYVNPVADPDDERSELVDLSRSSHGPVSVADSVKLTSAAASEDLTLSSLGLSDEEDSQSADWNYEKASRSHEE